MQKTFGYELEFNGAILQNLAKKYSIPLYKKRQIVPYNEYHLKNEIYVSNPYVLSEGSSAILISGGELISPILDDYEICLKELKFLLEALKKKGAYIYNDSLNTGFHIHLDRSFLLNYASLEKLLKFLYAFQLEIYNIAKGDHEVIRQNTLEDAKPLTMKFIRDILEFQKFELLKSKRNCILLNDKTLELRYFNSSLDWEVIDTYFTFAFGLREYVLSKKSDLELLDYYFQKALKEDDTLTLNRERYRVMQNILNI